MKLKISSGILKNSNLLVPKSAKPVKAIVKQSAFNYLGEAIKNKMIIDLFAGSGNIGIEAISRGAKFTTFVEQDYSAYKTIQENLVNLNIEGKAEVIHQDVLKYLGSCESKYDLIFADPPYTNPSNHFLKTVYMVCKNNSILIYFNKTGKNPVVENMKILETRTFGDSGYSIYKYQNPSSK